MLESFDLALLIRFLHVISGIMWIGLLYYFNFVQIPTMPQIPDDLKPAVGKHIAPNALFWFRWGAASTVLFGLVLAFMDPGLGLIRTMTLGFGEGSVQLTLIGFGMWFGLIMAFNVWFVIWPNQKKALGIVEADAETKAKSARTAMLFSRTNTLLSIPMLWGMLASKHLVGM